MYTYVFEIRALIKISKAFKLISNYLKKWNNMTFYIISCVNLIIEKRQQQISFRNIQSVLVQ